MKTIDIRNKQFKPECIIFGDRNCDNDAMCVRTYESDGYGTFMAIADDVDPEASAVLFIKYKEDAENLIKAIRYYIDNIGWD